MESTQRSGYLKTREISRSWHHAYNACRGLAKISLGIGRLLLGGNASLVQKGSIYDQMEGVMGEKKYRDLRLDESLLLETIYYCQVELSSVANCLQASRQRFDSKFDESEQKKRLFNHDYLVLKIRPSNQNDPAFLIEAEKVGGLENSEGKAGIHIVPREDTDDEDPRCSLHKIECRSHVRLDDLKAILTEESADYDAKDDNCWDYARNTTKSLLEACKNKAIDRHEKARLQFESVNLKAFIASKHYDNNIKRLFNTGNRAVKFLIT